MEPDYDWLNDDAKEKIKGKAVCKKRLEATDINYRFSGWPSDYKNADTYSEKALENMHEYKRPEQFEAPEKLRVFCVSWNAESINQCGFGNGNWYGSRSVGFTGRYDIPCYKNEDFVNFVIEKSKNADLIVISLQESVKPGDYLLSYTIPDKLRMAGFVLLRRHREMGAGATTAVTGKLRGLRMSILVRKELYFDMNIRTLSPPEGTFKACSNTSWTNRFADIIRGKGGIGITVNAPSFGNILFIDYHLPFVSERLSNNDTLELNQYVKHQIDCFKETFVKFVDEQQPDFVIVMGDLNFRLKRLREPDMFDENGKMKIDFAKWYNSNDELNSVLDKYIGLKNLKEGVDNIGPRFAPTCKMLKGRDSNCTDRKCYQVSHSDKFNRIPSWCDRILYAKIKNKPGLNMETIEYDRFDQGDMVCSDHAAVYSILEIGKNA